MEIIFFPEKKEMSKKFMMANCEDKLFRKKICT